MMGKPTDYYSPLAVGVASTVVIAAAGVTYMMAKTSSSRGKSVKLMMDLNDQSVVIDGKPEHRASRMAQAPDYTTFELPAPECQLVCDLLERGKRLSNNGPHCLGTRNGSNNEYTWKSYQEVIDEVHQFGSGLVNKGIVASNDTFIGIYAKNREEWTIADFGCQYFSMVPVPLYDSFGFEALTYILKLCSIKVVVTEKQEQVQTLLDMKDDVPSLALIIAIDSITDEEIKNCAKKKDVDLIQFTELLELGQKNLKDPVKPKPSDLFSLCFTSGTTGNPKGAMLTHENFLHMIEATYHHVMHNVPIGPGDYHLSYLPLAHNLERACHGLLLMQGGSVGYFRGDIKLLVEDIQVLRPTFFPSVPRLLTRIYDAVQTQVKGSFIKTKMLNWALASKMKDIKRSILTTDTIWDKLVFNKVRAKLGGRVRLLITGSAPLAPEVIDFLRCSLGCQVLEGYGQTEAGASLTFTVPGDPSSGAVGPPIPGCQIKLVDVPEMDYFTSNNVGEVCGKGLNVFKGYYKNEEQTKEALDEDGWLHTGDIGTWLPNGTLKIIDRKKNIFKLCQGEYIAPEKIETIYKGCPFVAQCYVDGNSLKPCIMGVIVPDADYLAVWAKNNGYPSNLEEFCEKKESKDLILKEIHQHSRKVGLTSLELVKDIILESNLFSVDNDLLTPTFKNKRPSLRKMYSSAINELYSANGL